MGIKTGSINVCIKNAHFQRSVREMPDVKISKIEEEEFDFRNFQLEKMGTEKHSQQSQIYVHIKVNVYAKKQFIGYNRGQFQKYPLKNLFDKFDPQFDKIIKNLVTQDYRLSEQYISAKPAQIKGALFE